MQFLDITLPTPEENLALDEALLIAAEADGHAEFLRLWEGPRLFVVLGKNCRVADDVWLDRCQADGVPVLRRSSGGGTVLQGPGCLNFAVVLRYDRAPGLHAVDKSIAYVLEHVRQAVAAFESRVELAGVSDLAVEERKFCGTAQRRLRTHFLQHGSILNNFDLGAIGRYLKEPSRAPAYRAGRDHSAFLANLHADSEYLRERLRSVWNAADVPAAWPQQIVRELVKEKYCRPDWNCRL